MHADLKTAPEFELPDTSGTMRSLSELTRSGRLIVLFYRGAW
jgi:peroxiredoxin